MSDSLRAKDKRWYGGGVDLEIWRSLPAAGGDSLSHELWCAVIRAIAAAVLKQHGTTATDEEFDTELSELITEWHDSAIPYDADLMWVIGSYSDYFQHHGFGWYEYFSFSGDACGFAHEVVWDLHGKLLELPDAKEAVTESLVERFYCEWRTRFLRRVLEEAESLKASDSNSSSHESHLE